MTDTIKTKTYCVKCKKDTENIDPKIFKTKNNKLIMQSQCTDCRNKKSQFVKKQDAKGLLSNLGIRTPLNKIPLLGDILFWRCIKMKKMNEIIVTFLLAGDTFMPEVHLRQPGFTYSARGPFTKNKERIEKFM